MISSIAAQTGGSNWPAPCGQQSWHDQLIFSNAVLLANAIAPALIDVDKIRGNNGINPDLLSVCRFGRYVEVTEAVVLLAAHGYIAGQT